ncbi:hypothetical protein DACRYDRAFT_119374 [Dacryopinax primogenitus]|uniref:Peroxisome assembly protein 12 n=1 Tax=Dacryopinax primogenitus (strain DJM 731) TaxID=1858805 RepID=M5FWE8_DACPD|nr:uncharacterized protein DACRYDRAFT_119374 [Dacryopinax primogenitus]EJT97716.1 hypothetical protein DACRYDRAFT_119374 [Dacryopinax primogenitus]
MDFYADIGASDTQRPSLFELLAQEQLRDLLQPAVKYVLAFFAQRYPRYLLRIVNRHEEFYALLMLVIERHYLRTTNASFSENFYGLKRRKKPIFEIERANIAAGGAGDHETLTPRARLLSLLFLVGVPYLRAKAEDVYEQLGGGLDPDLAGAETSQPRQISTSQTARARMLAAAKQAFKVAYPYANSAYHLWLFAWNIAYLFNKTSYYRPWLALIGVDLRRMTVEDMRMSGVVPSAATQSQPLVQRLLALFRPSTILSSLKQLLPLSLLTLKFLEWWYSPASPARFIERTTQGPPIPPPAPLSPHPKGVGVDPEKYGQCPVCKQEIVNATALPTGWICCYVCAYQWVKEKGTCPVTKLEVRVDELRKILV